MDDAVPAPADVSAPPRPAEDFVLWVQPATSELTHVLRTSIDSGSHGGNGAGKALGECDAGDEKVMEKQSVGGDGDSSDDDVPLSQKASALKLASPLAAPFEATAAAGNGEGLPPPPPPVLELEVPVEPAWTRHVGEEAWTALRASLDPRGQRERRLRNELQDTHRTLLARRELLESLRADIA